MIESQKKLQEENQQYFNFFQNIKTQFDEVTSDIQKSNKILTSEIIQMNNELKDLQKYFLFLLLLFFFKEIRRFIKRV